LYGAGDATFILHPCAAAFEKVRQRTISLVSISEILGVLHRHVDISL
jgi:hypothetical protein